MSKVRIIENRSEIGAGTRGASLGVDAIKIAALNNKSDYFSKHPSSIIKDYNHFLNNGVLNFRAKSIEILIDLYNSVANEVSTVLNGNNFPLILAGDHASAGGTIAGIKMANPDKKLGVIWIDAHADIHSPFTSPSGNMHGMSLATALSLDNENVRINELDPQSLEMWDKIKNLGGISPKIDPRDLVYVGLRDTEVSEDKFILDQNVKCFNVEDLRQTGFEKVSNDILSYLDNCDLIYISFDVDSLDCDLISYGTGTPVENGLTDKEAGGLINHLLIDKRTICFEIVEVNPCLDNKQNKMAETAFKILQSATSIIERRG